MKRSIGVMALLIALGLALGAGGCASGTQDSSGATGGTSKPAGGGSY
ncbi:MAG: hypothetical protein CBHOC_0639 [uncultured Caballeronia sp.]|nr:MAG: hypothetical protein CBHOC_0639 [uncultured Caballeronia sp.]